jgi:hypothetical protein
MHLTGINCSMNEPVFPPAPLLCPNKMNIDTFMVPTSLVQDNPGFPKLLCWIAIYYIEHLEERQMWMERKDNTTQAQCT